MTGIESYQVTPNLCLLKCLGPIPGNQRPRFPWDADIDANFIASHPVVIGSFLEEHEERLKRMGGSAKSEKHTCGVNVIMWFGLEVQLCEMMEWNVH